jgi:hypothetical protein
VGELRHGERAKYVIQSDFLRMKGPKPVGFSDSQFGLRVETLHDPTGELTFGSEPVQQQVAVSSQHVDHALHGLDL